MRFATRFGLQRTFKLSCSNETVVNAFFAVASKCVRRQIRPRISRGSFVAIHAWRVLVLASLIAAPLAGQDPPSGIQESSATNHAEESAPPLNRFGKDLVYNFGALFSKDNLRPAIIGTLVTSAAIPADRPVRDFFADMNRAGRLDAIGKQLGKSQLIGPAIGVSLLISRTTENARFQWFTSLLSKLDSRPPIWTACRWSRRGASAGVGHQKPLKQAFWGSQRLNEGVLRRAA